jgi:inositol transporter-like SP family MFS transporter
VVLLAAYFLEPFGISGVRWIFAHLAVLALVLTFLRSRMEESRRWEETRERVGEKAGINWRELFSPRYVKSMLYLISMYGLWNLWAGYNGFFTPYLIEQNNLPGWAATVLPASYFGVGIISILVIFMTLSDKVNQRLMFGISAIMHIVGMALLAIFGFKLEIVIAHILIMGVAGGFGAQSFFQLWSAELFPTEVRSTAQGTTFAVVRIGLGIWSLAVPTLATYDFTTLAWILTGFLVASGVIGFIWAPRNEGKSLEEIARERGERPVTSG